MFLLQVFLGGAAGALTRFGFELLFGFWYLGLVNLLGAWLLGLLHRRLENGTKRMAFWATGFAGSFTTMSAVSVLQAQYPALASGPALVLLLGILAYWIGRRGFGARAQGGERGESQ